MRVLVTGGAGYIGSHMTRGLLERGLEVTVLDNLSTGHRDAVGNARFVEGDLRDSPAIREALSGADAVMHFAASCYVAESMTDPQKYFSNNIVATQCLLAAMREAGVGRLVFSSSCSTYGEPRSARLDETHPQEPVNPYGYSKLVCERMMRDHSRAYGLDVVALRYFNAAGCDATGALGERHDPETHLIPLVLMEALRVRGGGAPQDTSLAVFGGDFDTPDGSCMRDYIHVTDLCAAHEAALQRMQARETGRFEAFNLGTESGASVLQVIDACRRVSGQDIRHRIAGRRPGDPSHLVADATLARRELGWMPRHDLDGVIGSAWSWFSVHGRPADPCRSR